MLVSLTSKHCENDRRPSETPTRCPQSSWDQLQDSALHSRLSDEVTCTLDLSINGILALQIPGSSLVTSNISVLSTPKLPSSTHFSRLQRHEKTSMLGSVYGLKAGLNLMMGTLISKTSRNPVRSSPDVPLHSRPGQVSRIHYLVRVARVNGKERFRPEHSVGFRLLSKAVKHVGGS